MIERSERAGDNVVDVPSTPVVTINATTSYRDAPLAARHQ